MAPFVALGRGDAAALVATAVRMAMADASLDPDLIDQIHVASVGGGAGIGERLLAPLGFTSTSLFNISDGCASGHTAFHLARLSLLAGEAECILVVGCDTMPADISSRSFFGLPHHGATNSAIDLANDPSLARIAQRQQPDELFCAQTQHLLTQVALPESTLQQVMAHARQRARHNPYALCAETAANPTWHIPYLAPPACGAAALLLCTPAFARRYGIHTDIACLVSLRGADRDDEQEQPSVLDVLGRGTTRRLASQAYALAGLAAEEIDVVELHDQTAGDYLISTAALGLCPPEQLTALAQDSHGRTPGGVVICPSGGLLGRGHAPGASAIAQLVELVWQLRGNAGTNQVAHARTALQHSTALGRAVSITLLQRLC
jgi:acetyl-CoA C-acetyltransferase